MVGMGLDPDVSTRVGPDQIFLSPLDNGWDHGSRGAVTGWPWRPGSICATGPRNVERGRAVEHEKKTDLLIQVDVLFFGIFQNLLYLREFIFQIRFLLVLLNYKMWITIC